MKTLTATNDYLIEDIINNPDYKIYEDGTIFTLIQKTGKRSINNTWRKLNPKPAKKYVRLTYKYKHLLIHRIIYRKFKGILDKDLVINHIDGNTQNNHITNLELVSQKINNLHSFRVLKRKPSMRSDVLNYELAQEIRKLKKEGLSLGKLAKMFNTCKSNIKAVVDKKTWINKNEIN